MSGSLNVVKKDNVPQLHYAVVFLEHRAKCTRRDEIYGVDKVIMMSL
jgi:hypothetical protein